MAPVIEMDEQLMASMRLGDPLLVAVQVRHEATAREAVAGRRDQRALRSRAMIELALAWADPVWRRHWRTAGR
ncbi:hypothetical protein LPB72_16195 [Hydrogenophaga crassostreae]|uniref:Uncharacterized protein n=1 Tax=Hydrogenophaga crassostreae TaxID=1763535 RepID=A0A162P2F3_9BURK|nr:hypothetical protein [Hydrogenophaga crassostreae]AOW12580.1 hypothetical protein LPB072_06710 [Hydrogenophaga crassostreae]OAD40450.1 hypothetical protein LPB72_16195 [Hydrogenophaga crassostreae]